MERTGRCESWESWSPGQLRELVVVSPGSLGVLDDCLREPVAVSPGAVKPGVLGK